MTPTFFLWIGSNLLALFWVSRADEGMRAVRAAPISAFFSLLVPGLDDWTRRFPAESIPQVAGFRARLLIWLYAICLGPPVAAWANLV